MHKTLTSLAALAISVAAFGGAATVTAAPDESTPSNGEAVVDPILAPQPLAERTTVRVALSKITVFAPLFVADALGEFDKENIDVVIVDVPPQERLPVLAEGDVDVSYAAFGAGVYNLIASGVPIRWTFPGQGYDSVATQQGYWINTDTLGTDGLQASELRDVDIVNPSGAASISGWHLWEWARVEDPTLELSDLTFATLTPADTAIALSNGGIDLGFLVSPGTEQVAASGCACMYVDTNVPLEPTGAYIFGPNMLFDDREVGEAFVRAMARTTQMYLQGDYLENDDVAQALADATDTPIEVIRQAAPMIFDPAVPLLSDNLGAQDFYRQLGLLTYDEENDLQPEDAFDQSFLDAVFGR